MWCGEREAQPQPCEAEEFPERPQHDDVAAVDFAGEAGLGRADIHERLVHDEESAPVFQILRQCKQPVFCDNPPIRIVWIGDDGQIGAVKLLDICCFRDLVSGKGGGPRMLGIGRTENCGLACRRQRRNQRQQNLGAWCGCHVGGGRGSIGPRGDPREPRLRLGIGQSREHAGGNRRQRVRKGIDSG